MKATLEYSNSLDIKKISDMLPMQFAVIIDGQDKGSLLFRPLTTREFVINLTDGSCWDTIPRGNGNKYVRILQDGESIVITDKKKHLEMKKNECANKDEAVLYAAAQRLFVSGSYTPTKRGEPRQRANFAITKATMAKLDELAKKMGSSRTEIIERSVSEMHRLLVVLKEK